MKILLIGDTHGKLNKVRDIWPKLKDIDLIASKTKQSESGNTIVVTTEKDAMRLIEYMRNNPGDDAEFIRNRYQDFYVLPVEVKFMKEKQDEFNQIILSYVQKNSRTSTLSKRL